jgi:hypothetical protein
MRFFGAASFGTSDFLGPELIRRTNYQEGSEVVLIKFTANDGNAEKFR